MGHNYQSSSDHISRGTDSLGPGSRCSTSELPISSFTMSGPWCPSLLFDLPCDLLHIVSTATSSHVHSHRNNIPESHMALSITAVVLTPTFRPSSPNSPHITSCMIHVSSYCDQGRRSQHHPGQPSLPHVENIVLSLLQICTRRTSEYQSPLSVPSRANVGSLAVDTKHCASSRSKNRSTQLRFLQPHVTI